MNKHQKRALRGIKQDLKAVAAKAGKPLDDDLLDALAIAAYYCAIEWRDYIW